MKESNVEQRTTTSTDEQAPGAAPAATSEATFQRATTTPGDTNHENTSHACLCCRCTFFPQLSRSEWIVMFVTSLVALILCDAATDVCGFLEASVYLGRGVACDRVPVAERRDIGINVYEDEDGECVPWRKGTDKDNVYHSGDELWIVVRYLVGIASVFSLLLVIALGFSACISYPRPVWMTMAMVVHLVWLLYSLSFMLFGADVCQEPPRLARWYDDCVFGTGAALMLVGVLVWMPASLLVWRLACTTPKRTAASRNGNNNFERSNDQETDRNQQDVFVDPSSQDAPEEKDKYILGWLLTWAIVVVISIAVNVLVISLMRKGERTVNICITDELYT